MQIYSRFFPLLLNITPPQSTLLAILFLMIVENALALLIPWVAGQFTQTIFNGETILHFSYKGFLLCWFSLLSLQVLISYYNIIVSGTTTEKMLTKLRIRLYNHLQSLPISYFHDHKHGNTLALLTNDCAIISSFITNTALSMLPNLLTAAGSLFCIFLISPLVAGLTGFLIPLFYLTTKLLGRRIRPISQGLLTQYAATFALAEENLATLPIIKSFTREQLESNRFEESNLQLFNLSTNYLRAHSRLAPVIRFLSFTIIMLILWVLGDDIATGKLSAGQVVSLMLYGMLLAQPIGRLADTYGSIQRTLAAEERLLRVFNTQNESYRNGIVLPAIQGRIVFEDITFLYPEREPILKNLNLTIQPGETVAITGENGAGKSTIAHLLMRFFLPQQGRILIDGHDIQSVSLDSLRSQIGIVQQHVLLQNSSIANNILFGKANASKGEVRAAAKAAHALEFIEKLPDGFETMIGDQGVKLSGGQKQRLSLARALLKNPAILILDEATAMFDPKGEIAFITENRNLLSGRTVIIITHRPASLALADRILFLKNGCLVPNTLKP